MKLNNSVSHGGIQHKRVTRIGLKLIKQDIPVDTCLGHGFEVTCIKGKD